MGLWSCLFIYREDRTVEHALGTVVLSGIGGLQLVPAIVGTSCCLLLQALWGTGVVVWVCVRVLGVGGAICFGLSLEEPFILLVICLFVCLFMNPSFSPMEMPVVVKKDCFPREIRFVSGSVGQLRSAGDGK